MKKIVSFIAGFLCIAQVYAACTVTDDAGHVIALRNPAKRVIVLAPDLVEDVFAIGAGDRIVGVINGSDYPAAALKIPVVGSYSGIDVERVVALQPDLIITWQYAFPRQMRLLHAPVFVAAPKQLTDVPRLLQQLGCLLGREQAAQTAAQRFTNELRAMKRADKRPAVFIQLDEDRLITINKDSWINQAIEWCGGVNVFANAATISPEINREDILNANPDIILGVSKDDRWQQHWQRWPLVAAVKHKRLYTLHPDWISRAGPRLVLGVREICSDITY